jgi:plastocyanin
MFRIASLLALMLASTALPAATLTVRVRDGRGAPVQDAVVYAVPEGRAVPAPKRTAVMDQKNRMFVPHVLAIQTGTAVKFPNSDDIRHQVYSFSSAKPFELPLYKGTPSNPIVFTTPGVATLGCNIHDRMSAYIVIVDTPHFATTPHDGRVTLDGLEAGRYVVNVWAPGVRDAPPPVTITLTSGDHRDLTFDARKGR